MIDPDPASIRATATVAAPNDHSSDLESDQGQTEPRRAAPITDRRGHVDRILQRRQTDGSAVSELPRNVTRWRSAAAARHASALL